MTSARTRNHNRHHRFAAEARAGGLRLRCVLSAGACLAAALGPGGPALAEPPSTPGAAAYTTNASVYALARAGGRTYIGGDFTRVGVRSGSGAVLSPTDGSRRTFPEVAGGDVRAVVSDGQGGWYIGGSFTTVGGQPHVGLGHILGDGSVDSSFNPAVTDSSGKPAAVNALAYSSSPGPDQGTLYVGGEFGKIGVGSGQFRTNIAALDGSDGSAVKTWAPVTSAAVRTLAVTRVPLAVAGATQDVPVLFAGGDFDTAGSNDAQATVRGLAAIWGVGAVDFGNQSIAGSLVTKSDASAWAPAPAAPAPAAVRALRTSPVVSTGAPPTTAVSLAVYFGRSDAGTSTVLAASQFKIADQTSRNAEAPQSFSNWQPEPRCTGTGCIVSANALALTDSRVYFAGDFSRIKAPTPQNQVDATRVAWIATVPDPANPTAGTLTYATPLGAADAPVRALAASNDGLTLFMGGDFSRRLAEVDTATGDPTDWAPAPDAPAQALATDPSTASVYAGGRFSSVGSVERRGLAAFDASGALLDWSPGLAPDPEKPPLVRALAASDSTVYVGGRFDEVTDPGGGSHPHANLAAVDAGSGTPLDGFNPAPSGDKAQVLALSLLDSTLYVGGRFDHVGGQSRANLAALDAASGAATGWNPGANDNVHALLPACGAVYVAGGFTRAGAVDRDYVAALDPTTGSATGWNPEGADAAVLSLARYGPTIYAGGNFTYMGGKLRQKIAALDVADGTVRAFNPNANGSLHAIAATDAAVYAGGSFTQIGSEDRANLAALDPATGHATAWNPSPDGTVRGLAAAGDNVYAGGDFDNVGALSQRGFAPFESGPAETAAGACVPPAPPPPPPPPALPSEPSPTPAPACVKAVKAVSRLKVRPRRVRRGGRPLAVRFRLSCPTTVRLRFERRVARACPRKRRRAHRAPCVRYVRVADVQRRGRRGANHVVFKRQRVRRRTLVPGRYRVTLKTVPVRSSGAKARAQFTVMPRRRQ